MTDEQKLKLIARLTGWDYYKEAKRLVDDRSTFRFPATSEGDMIKALHAIKDRHDAIRAVVYADDVDGWTVRFVMHDNDAATCGNYAKGLSMIEAAIIAMCEVEYVLDKTKGTP